MATRFSIRPATVADVPAVTAAERRCFADPWSAESIASLFESKAFVGLVGERTGPGAELVGYLFARAIADEAEVLNIAVIPEDRGRGLGGLLLDRGLAALERRAMSSVFLEVRESNQPARLLYLSRGFRPVGLRANYYRKPLENALILRRNLGPAAF